MGILTLMNDVESSEKANGFLPSGDSETLSEIGQVQIRQTAEFFNEKISKIEEIYSSPSRICAQLLHHVRSKSLKEYLTKLPVKKREDLKERNFGILGGSVFGLTSDLFKHTRVCGEQGESVSQCRTRAMRIIRDIAHSHVKKSILVVSHSFLSQIISNVLLRKNHTILTEFWMNKGSFASFKMEETNFGLTWSFMNGYNPFNRESHTEEEIYSRVLGV